MRPTGSSGVLVVEDDDGVRALICETLCSAGYDAVGTADGREAVEYAELARPDAAILDVNLPGLSGYEVCHALRRFYGRALPILFVSGVRTESYDRIAGLLLGADDYLAKPFAPDELLSRMEALLSRALAGSSRSSLTPREREVLELLAGGLEQAKIAVQLEISTNTVSTHIERILFKLEVHSRAQAVALAFREQLVALPA
jgi:DNA-binding NarL/FixJ family response regulator